MALSENAELEELIRRATTDGRCRTARRRPSPGRRRGRTTALDLGTLVLVARRSLVWVLLLLLLGITASWLYLCGYEAGVRSHRQLSR
ncbi:MAG: hypothetical protein WKG07_07140 [Hymenobacter sp.]